MKTIICATCGKEAVKTGRNQKYCPDCTGKANLMQKQAYKKRKRMEAVVSAPKSNHAEIAMVTAEARRRGLTYGQMVAMGR